MQNSCKQLTSRRKHNAGYTLLELLTTTAILGVLFSMAAPYMQSYTVRAKSTEGLLILGELRRRVETEFYERGVLPSEIPNSPTPNGSKHGGPGYSYTTMFGQADDMWELIEYQPNGPHRVIAQRAYRLPEWQNSDIGLHLQIKQVDENTLAFRCTVNNTQSRMQFVPSSCQDGSVNDWVSW
jgi:prepilin-type N-terminal cleavage/methylation domain-containing protein